MAQSPLLTPILAAAYSRSGSTLLMQLLASTDEIALERVYPFEARYLTYFLRWCSLPFAPEKRRNQWNNGHLMTEGVPSLMGAFPWNDAESRIIPSGGADFSATAFRALWAEFSARCGGAKYYAEKTPLWLGQSIAQLLPEHRTIYLVRDPRDVWLSILAFDKKRGFYGFGRREGENVEDYRARFLEEQRQRFVTLSGLEENSPRHCLIRYEDMAADLNASAHKLSDWLGVRLNADAVLAQRPAMAHHITSDGQSVERWRREMPTDEQSLFADTLGDVMRDFYR